MTAVGTASGLGFGWINTLGTANVVRSWMSPPTLLALGTGQIGILLGLGDHTTAVLSLTRAIGVLIIAIVVSWLVCRRLRRRAPPGRRLFRITTIVVTLVVGIFGPTANGDRFALFQIFDATIASAITVLILIAITSSLLPRLSVPPPVTS